MTDIPTNRAGSFFITGGTLPLDAGSYVVRQADTDLYDGLISGEFCYVLTTRQMGKSSLMVRTAVRLRAAGVSVAVLDLTAVGQNLTPYQWYDGLLNRLGRQLDLEDELEEYYHQNARLGPLQRFMEAIARIALRPRQSAIGNRQSVNASPPHPLTHSPAHPTSRLVIFVDEIDAVRSLPFPADEFFAAIRECYNRRTEEPLYRNLTFCLLGVATPADLVTDTRVSPFNIGKRIVLSDFTPEEAEPLAQGLISAALNPKSKIQNPKFLERVLHWTNGHPYMTQRLCRAVAEALVGSRQLARSEGTLSRNSAGEHGAEASPAHPLTPSPPHAAANSPPDPRGLVDTLAASLFFSKDARDNDDNLAFVRNRLLRTDGDIAALLDLYRKVRTGRGIKDDETNTLISLLRLSGIVAVRDGFLVVRNRIYEQVFSPQWIAANMPDAEVRRQSSAYRAGVLRAAIFGGAIAAAMAALAISSLVWKHRADVSATSARIEAEGSRKSMSKALAGENRERLLEQKATELAQSELAEKQRVIEYSEQIFTTLKKLTNEQKIAQANYQRAEVAVKRAVHAEGVQKQEMSRLNRVLYDATMNLVQREYEAHEYDRMQALLNQTRLAEDRGFEWRFWQGLCPLQRTLNAHVGEVLCATSAPDGRRFVTGGADKSVVVSDALSGKTVCSWKEDGEVRAASYSPDGRRIAIGLSGNDRPGRAVIRDADTGRALVTLPLFKAAWDVSFSHSGKLLATNGDRVQLWNSATGAAEQDYGPGGPAVVFSPDDTKICYSRWSESGKPGVVEVTDLSTNMVSYSLNGQIGGGQVRAVAWSPDGTRLATGSDDRIARIWNAQTGSLVRPLQGHSDGLLTVAFSPDGKRLLTSSLDDESRVWDLDIPSDSVRPTFASPVNPRARPPLRDLRLFSRENRVLFKHARQATFSADGRQIVTGSYSGMVRVWSAAPPASYLVLDGPPVVSLDHLGAVAFAPDNRKIVSSIDSPIATLWDTASAMRLRDFRGHTGNISALTFFPDSSHVASGGMDGSVRIWNTGIGRRALSLQGHKGGVKALAISDNGRLLVSTGEDGTGIVWDLRTQKRLSTLHMTGSVAQSVAISPDGTKIVAAQTDNAMAGRITLWDANTGQMRRTIATMPSRILAVRSSPDGTRILAGVDDKTARIWDVSSGRLLVTLSGHTSGVNSVAFSADGRRVVTGSFDTTAKLWDAHTGHEILTLHHPTFVVGVALSQDGRRIVTACEDGSTRVWTAE